MGFNQRERTGENCRPLGAPRRWGSGADANGASSMGPPPSAAAQSPVRGDSNEGTSSWSSQGAQRPRMTAHSGSPGLVRSNSGSSSSQHGGSRQELMPGRSFTQNGGEPSASPQAAPSDAGSSRDTIASQNAAVNARQSMDPDAASAPSLANGSASNGGPNLMYVYEPAPPPAPRLKRARPSRAAKREPSPAGSDPWDNLSDDGTDVEDEDEERQSKRKIKHESSVQLIGHLPKADDAALATFTEVEGNIYHGKIGRSSGGMSGMACDCSFNPRKDTLKPSVACGEDAECINRLTQIECDGSCRCRDFCQNKRFQKREYCRVDIVKTEKKGFGLRAKQDIEADAFVYEYYGDVVAQGEFLRRMEEYKQEGFEHFYFMMLAREEFIDATRTGSRARFINHSCNPNCYVSKWHVGKHMRMGIFAKRPIQANEELTFNYNVDRYGNDSQPCYCGEPNCVGTIGGKKQTDVAVMDELYIDALGITDEVNLAGARGSKSKKSKLLGDDFKPTLSPVPKEDVAMVINATRQASANERVLPMLLTRIQLTSDPDVNRAFVQLNGLVVMSGILEEWRADAKVVMLVLGCLARWPLLSRNKVTDTGIEAQVKELTKAPEQDIAEVARSISEMWNALSVGYRIARRESEHTYGEDPMAWGGIRRDYAHGDDAFEAQSEQAGEPVPLPFADASQAPMPVSLMRPDQLVPAESQDTAVGEEQAHDEPTQEEIECMAAAERAYWPARPAPPSVSEVIERAKQRREAERRMQEEAMRAVQASAIAAAERAIRKQGVRALPTDALKTNKRRRKHGSARTPERRLYKLIGELVVATMSKYKASFERESFKRHAKELTELLCSKEVKKEHEKGAWPPADGEVALSEEKRGKMKKFAKEYIHKIVARREKTAKAKAQAAKGAANATIPSAANPSAADPSAAVGPAGPGEPAA